MEEKYSDHPDWVKNNKVYKIPVDEITIQQAEKQLAELMRK